MPPEHYLVVDLEAMYCDRGSIPRGHMEIIEIGAVMAEATDFQPVGEFHSFVRPVTHPHLTAFCTELTSIRQNDVDAAPPFREAIALFQAWLAQYDSFVFCSWDDYDRKQLQKDCLFHRVSNPIDAPHCNVKRILVDRHHLSKKLTLAHAIRLAGLEFLGTHHRGIDDARNVVRLLPYAIGSARMSTALRTYGS